jgi:hypothetical protein
MNTLRLFIATVIIMLVAGISSEIAAQKLLVAQPVAGFHGQAGTTITIRWTGLSATNAVRISVWSAQEGRWRTLVRNYLSNMSQFDWQVSDDASLGAYRIKVEDLSSNDFGISNAFFYVDEALPVVADVSAQPGERAEERNDITASDAELALYPNPARNELRVESKRTDMAELTVTNVNGEEVTRVNADHGNGVTVIHLPSNLPSGRYLIVARYRDTSIISRNFDVVK